MKISSSLNVHNGLIELAVRRLTRSLIYWRVDLVSTLYA